MRDETTLFRQPYFNMMIAVFAVTFLPIYYAVKGRNIPEGN